MTFVICKAVNMDDLVRHVNRARSRLWLAQDVMMTQKIRVEKGILHGVISSTIAWGAVWHNIMFMKHGIVARYCRRFHPSTKIYCLYF